MRREGPDHVWQPIVQVRFAAGSDPPELLIACASLHVHLLLDGDADECLWRLEQLGQAVERAAVALTRR